MREQLRQRVVDVPRIERYVHGIPILVNGLRTQQVACVAPRCDGLRDQGLLALRHTRRSRRASEGDRLFSAIKAVLLKAGSVDRKRTEDEKNSALKQILDNA